ncbi:MAG: bacteriohemerythrin [Thermodesulfobacteriota bacterium]
MGSPEWKEDFCTGIDEMDEHHRNFFDYLKQLEAAAGGSKGREILEPLLKKLDDYVKHHFSEEERLLELSGFQELERQKRQHEFFAAQVADLKQQFSNGNAYIPISTLAFLKDWFLHHILESDKKYGEYISEIRN